MITLAASGLCTATTERKITSYKVIFILDGFFAVCKSLIKVIARGD